jgi:hypothetical protein
MCSHKQCWPKGRRYNDRIYILKLESSGGIMTTSPSQSLGQYVQLAGAGAFITGAILSLHHYAIGICFVAGAAAFYVGKKMRAA